METMNQISGSACSANEKQNALMSLLHTTNLIRKQRERIFEKQEINQTKFNVLQILEREFPVTLSQNEIREKVGDKTIDLSRIIDQMDRMCLVTQSKYKQDRRISEITITRKGIETLNEMAKYEDEMSLATASLSNEDTRQLIAAMQKITDALAEPCLKVA